MSAQDVPPPLARSVEDVARLARPRRRPQGRAVFVPGPLPRRLPMATLADAAEACTDCRAVRVRCRCP